MSPSTILQRMYTLSMPLEDLRSTKEQCYLSPKRNSYSNINQLGNRLSHDHLNGVINIQNWKCLIIRL